MDSIDHWLGLTIHERISEGDRSTVWSGSLAGRAVAVRQSRRTTSSLEWELDLLAFLGANGFSVNDPIPSEDGPRQVEGLTVHRWIDGRPPSSVADWKRVTKELRRLHRITLGRPQRPGACSVTELHRARQSVDADLDRTPDEVIEQCVPHFDAYLEGHRTVIHGDPMAGNIRIAADGRVAFLDWDEARVDLPDLDLANLGRPVLTGTRRRRAESAASAWETLNGWIVEPTYARSRLLELRPPVPAPDPVLDDGVIRLRPRTALDVDAQHIGEDDEIIRWLTGGVATRERIEQHVGHLARQWNVSGTRRNFGIYLAEAPDTLIGNLDINLADLDLALDEANLSYAVFAPWRGNGFAARAVELGILYLAKTEQDIHPALKIEPTNVASVRVAVKTGFAPSRTIDWRDDTLTVHRLHPG